MAKVIKFLLKALFVGACLLYAFWGLNWSDFAESFSRFQTVPMLVILLVSCTLPFAVMSLRFSFLTGHAADWFTSLKASVLCLGLNNIFPAKLGEVAKAFYVRRKCDISLGQGLGMIFWERFADLNCLLAMGVISAMTLQKNFALIPLLAIVGGLWVCILALRFFPALGQLLTRFIPSERLKLLFAEIIHQLQTRMSPGFFFKLSVYSIVFWTANLSVSMLTLAWVGQLSLSMSQMLTVFVVVTLGFAMPSSPGGLGVVEAGFVLSLGWFGVSKAEALALAIYFRFLSFVPPTLGALVIMAKSGLSMKGLRQQGEETL